MTAVGFISQVFFGQIMKVLGNIKEYRYTKPGRAVIPENCFYGFNWHLWRPWPVRPSKLPKWAKYILKISSVNSKLA